MSDINISELRDSLGITQTDLAELIGVSLRTIQNYEAGGVIPKSKYAILRRLKKEDENRTVDFRESHGPSPDTFYAGEIEKLKQENAELKKKTFEAHIPVKLVTIKARAGYAGVYYADEYLKSMPTILIETDKEYHGKYLAFEIDGDSMEPEYNKGDIVICREIKRDLWQYKLHFTEWDFVIAHGTKGIMLKEIVSHDVESGDIVCHSLNHEDGRNKDFTLNLREIAFLYNVVEHRISGKNKRRSR